jgi:hypothetical protein
MADAPKSLMEAIQYFGDPDNALKYLVSLRWPNGVVCPYCEHKTPSFVQSVVSGSVAHAASSSPLKSGRSLKIRRLDWISGLRVHGSSLTARTEYLATR